jgi:stearoyl-CoA desaturase (delta-9 desaturase)
MTMLPASPSPVEPTTEPKTTEPDGGPLSTTERVVTLVVVGVPFIAVILAAVAFWGRAIALRDLILALVAYALVGHGITIGYHRLLAHRSFVASRPVKLALLVLGSMAFEGGPIGWVADHRRHHVFSDTPDDPHSPHRPNRPMLAGLWHAHVGWLFTHRRTSWQRHAADLLADRDVRVVNALFPLWCVASLAIPFGLGWIFGGAAGALSALLWAGFVRVCLLHHATWSINSLCHMFGRRPFTTKDRSTNLGALAVISMGESWHNGHHAFPRSARHGLLSGQWDSSARVISMMERLGWVTAVHQPNAELLRRRQRLSRSG